MRSTFYFLFSVTLVFSIGSHAALGEDESTVQADQTKIKATRKVQQMSTYNVHTMTMGHTVVKEYVTTGGKVFAVSWTGMGEPDLSVLLGSYYGEYHVKSAKTKKSKFKKQALQIQSQNIVVEKGGRFNAIYGKAYVPSLMPSTVSPGDLQ